MRVCKAFSFLPENSKSANVLVHCLYLNSALHRQNTGPTTRSWGVKRLKSFYTKGKRPFVSRFKTAPLSSVLLSSARVAATLDLPRFCTLWDFARRPRQLYVGRPVKCSLPPFHSFGPRTSKKCHIGYRKHGSHVACPQLCFLSGLMCLNSAF